MCICVFFTERKIFIAQGKEMLIHLIVGLYSSLATWAFLNTIIQLLLREPTWVLDEGAFQRMGTFKKLAQHNFSPMSLSSFLYLRFFKGEGRVGSWKTLVSWWGWGVYWIGTLILKTLIIGSYTLFFCVCVCV